MTALFACTIVARNYLPLARVLARSFLEHNPGSRFATLVIDDRDRAVWDEPFEIVHLDDLVPGERERHVLAAYYDVMELATAVKPLLLMHLLRQTSHPVVYLDPDIQVYAPLTPVEQGIRQASIALTPHTLVAYPRDGLRPTEAEILGAGVYNLGFIGVADGAEDFLRWWWDRLQRDAVVDPARMLFTDQRWVDFVPGLFPHVLLKHPGLNVAYWNLHGRRVEPGKQGYLVNGEPLVFFHFSGYSPFSPDVLSKHTGDHPRVRLQDSPAVGELAQAYGARLLEEGLARGGGPEYAWDFADGGVRLDPPARRAFRQALLHAEGSGNPQEFPPDPFTPGGGAALLTWLASPAPQARWPMISRYLQAVYDMRPDLQAAFPASAPDAGRAFLAWARHGALGSDRPESEMTLLTGAARPAAPPRRLPHEGELPAVHVVGYFRAELGMGEYGRQLVEAVRAAGAPVSTTTWTETISRQQHEFQDEGADEAAPVNLLVVNADQTPALANAVGPPFFEGRYTVGAWAWEVEDFPAAFDEAFSHVDEVWAISSFTRDAIARRTDKPVFAVPPAISGPAVDASITRQDLGLPEGFLFLFSFDFLSIPKRKNALGLVRAFTDAFSSGEGPVLVIKSINGDRQRDAQGELRAATAHREDIVLLEDYLNSAQRTALMAHADCYVSLHRSEGLGLTIAESMALGKPVIATGYSGNMDFMDEQNSFLVPYDRVAVGSGAEPYAASSTWAEPRLHIASALMRQVWQDPAAALRVGARAAEDIAQKHSPTARAALVRERLLDLAKRLPIEPTAEAPALPAKLSLTPLQRKVRRARFLIHVARTPEMRRAAVRRRIGGVVSAGFGQSRRAIAEQEATRRELVALRARLDMLARDVDEAGRRLTGVAERIQGTESYLTNNRHHSETVAAHANALDSRLDALVERLDHAGAADELATRRLDELSERVHHLKTSTDRIADDIEAAPYTSDPDALRVHGRRGATLGYTDAGRLSTYADFEDLFRGTTSFIRDRQRVYLPVLADAGPVLDLGCGRGEMLTVLHEAGVDATGVDLDASMVRRCQAESLPVVLANAIDHLREVPAGSLGAVTSFQFIEHLALGDLEELMALAHRALRPGGLLVAETVNPHSARALKVFWLDLTHRHPIFPEAALMLTRGAGFSSGEIFFPHGSGDYEHDRLTQGEYAVIAKR
jgi:2-polyprenyl-3-methyl-5-hydroxy-6-metoxy-1,4-benzoquinol methylase/glycosyltransferase involved in cell wall biosynthesis